MERKLIHSRINHIVAKIRQKKANSKNHFDPLYLRHGKAGRAFRQRKMAEFFHWALMNNYIEEQIPRAGELSAKLLDRFNFAKMIEKRISLVSILRIFPK
ncbi:hypothetical protein BLA29_006531 [Euroglyphus maynei]|uniref:Uncharacterized protein n=1 Tax=Euroglyphus maynei TaxID=6958 RepID=A0A1Y3ANP7_EURMA|nr:hypothetical protein BLA29_006531 [Euroglyphus maynei]